MNHEVMHTVSPSSKKHYVVPLEKIPEHFSIPADLQTRFSYDPAHKRLDFQGWMCKATYDRLRNISSDYGYQRALERLFQMAEPEEETPPRKSYGILVTVGVLVLAVAVAGGVVLLKHL